MLQQALSDMTDDDFFSRFFYKVLNSRFPIHEPGTCQAFSLHYCPDVILIGPLVVVQPKEEEFRPDRVPV
jgi:hypothetical protein